MKTLTSFIASSLMAFTLVTAHGAEAINSSSQGDNQCFNSLQEKEAQPIVLKLHENNDGAKVTVPSGSLVKVILEAQAASTGFDWASTFSSPNILEFKHMKIKQASSHLIGAPAQECWIFTAAAPGQTTLTFSLARSWEKDVAPVKTVRFDITVE
jgi:predicted secreted protein